MNKDKIREAFEKTVTKEVLDVFYFSNVLNCYMPKCPVYSNLARNTTRRLEGYISGYKSAMKEPQAEIERLQNRIGSLESDVKDCEHQVECRDKMIKRLKCCGNCFHGSGGTNVPWKEVCKHCPDYCNWEAKE